jgi:hypothetical protein
MRHALAIAGLAAGLGIAVGLLIGQHQTHPATEPEKSQLAVSTQHVPQPETAPQVLRHADQLLALAPPPHLAKPRNAPITIPLKEVYAITPQIGDTEIPPAIDERWETILAPLRGRLDKTGMSSTFLVAVRGAVSTPAIHRAMAGTLQVYDSRRETDMVNLTQLPGEAPTPWLFVLIKTGINDRELELSSIVVEGHRVAVSLHYTEPQPKFQIGHLLTYAFWAPLPKSDSSEPYVLTVSDNLAPEPLLVRRVLVVR